MADETHPWNGLPENPERNGWHWIVPIDPESVWPVFWRADTGWQWWSSSTDEDEPGEYTANLASRVWKYGGPCYTAADLAAAREAGRWEGIEQAAEMAEAELQRCKGRIETDGVSNRPFWGGCASTASIIKRDILGLLPAPPQPQEPGA